MDPTITNRPQVRAVAETTVDIRLFGEGEDQHYVWTADEAKAIRDALLKLFPVDSLIPTITWPTVPTWTAPPRSPWQLSWNTCGF